MSVARLAPNSSQIAALNPPESSTSTGFAIHQLWHKHNYGQLAADSRSRISQKVTQHRFWERNVAPMCVSSDSLPAMVPRVPGYLVSVTVPPAASDQALRRRRWVPSSDKKYCQLDGQSKKQRCVQLAFSAWEADASAIPVCFRPACCQKMSC